MKKLTLSMEERDIREARRIASEHGTSISGMFTRLVRAIGRKGRNGTTSGQSTDELSPLTRKALGMISLPKGKTDRQLIEEALLDRHGFKR